jgi:hypothetical protein
VRVRALSKPEYAINKKTKKHKKRRNTMKHPEDSPGSRNAKNSVNNNNPNNKISKRSNNMKNKSFIKSLSRGISVLLAIILVAAMAFGQSISSGASATFSGSGSSIINVAGNITNAAALNLPGTVNLTGTSTQTIGSGGTLQFATLKATAVSAKTIAVNTTVTAAIDVTSATTTQFDIGTNKLTLQGTINNAGGAANPYKFNGSGAEVEYAGSSSQAVWGTGTHYNKLTLSGSGGFTLAADVTVDAALSHTGGALSIGNNLTTGTSYAFASITDITAAKTLLLSSTGGTIATLTDNHGVIDAATHNSAVTFTNGAKNDGTINGGTALVKFSSTLDQETGTITAGSGKIEFDGAVTRNGGSIASAALANTLQFKGAVNGSVGTIDLTGTGAAEYGSTISSTTNLNYAAGTTVTYNGTTAGQVIADMNYAGNLVLTGGTKDWTIATAAKTIGGNLTLNANSATSVTGAFALNVTGNVALSSDLTVANAVVFAQTTSTVTNSGGQYDIVGTVTRTHSLAATAYTFNNPATTVQATANAGNLTSFSLTVSPGVNPTNYTSSTTINRKIVQSYASTGAFTLDVKLGYLNGEIGTLTENRLRDFANGITKTNLLDNVSTDYTRVGSVLNTNFGSVNLVNIASTSLTSGQELALDTRFYQFKSIASGAWSAIGTWDANAVPTAFDDVEMAATFPVTIADAYAASALSVTIDASSSLTVGAGASGSLTVGTGGVTNNATGTGLTVANGATLTINSGTLTNNGAVTNNGTITVQ